MNWIEELRIQFQQTLREILEQKKMEELRNAGESSGLGSAVGGSSGVDASGVEAGGAVGGAVGDSVGATRSSSGSSLCDRDPILGAIFQHTGAVHKIPKRRANEDLNMQLEKRVSDENLQFQAHLIYGGEPAVLTLVTTLFTVGARIKKGERVYDVYQGSFGRNRKVIAKRAVLDQVTEGQRHESLVRNDVDKMENLQFNPCIARVFHCSMDKIYAYVAVEEYKFNLRDYVNYACVSDDYKTYKPTEVCRQTIEAVQFLNKEKIIHGDLRLKNFYVHVIRSKYIHVMSASRI